MKIDYNELNHPLIEELHLSVCYLCDEKLGGVIDRDHIIPNSLYPSGAEKRVKLPVHKRCNNKKKLEDQRFKYRLLMMTNLNPVAKQKLQIDLIDPMSRESAYASLIGFNKKIPKYKLGKTLGKEFSKLLDITHKGQELSTVQMDKKAFTEFSNYSIRMAKGVLVRNVKDIRPTSPHLYWFDRRYMEIKGVNIDTQMKPLLGLIENKQGTFSQIWEKHFGYIGSGVADNPEAGYVYFDFFDGFGILCVFTSDK